MCLKGLIGVQRNRRVQQATLDVAPRRRAMPRRVPAREWRASLLLVYHPAHAAALPFAALPCTPGATLLASLCVRVFCVFHACVRSACERSACCCCRCCVRACGPQATWPVAGVSLRRRPFVRRARTHTHKDAPCGCFQQSPWLCACVSRRVCVCVYVTTTAAAAAAARVTPSSHTHAHARARRRRCCRPGRSAPTCAPRPALPGARAGGV